MDLQHLERLRLYELERVLAYAKPWGRVLEIGAGSGFQARELARRGFEVEAVDLPSSAYAHTRVFPIRDYDGKILPFPDGSFDWVFSSNVLEHVPELDAFLGEICRVLRPGGRAIHVLPTATWRIWTTLSHYPLLAKLALKRLAARAPGRIEPEAPALPGSGRGRFRREMLIPQRHGAHGSLLAEHWLFSRARWRGVFGRSPFRIDSEAPAELFYTGSSLLGDRLDLSTRRALARLLGCSSRIWILIAR
jgi:SAM-dependent methyltransferase